MKKRETCNVVQAHKRIFEAHRLWHQALNCYFDPEGFRTNVNAAIQALRNVTFAIQNEKHNIPDFDKWYATWQAHLKEDEIMRWLCDARTDIVHKKDLQMYSLSTVTVRCYDTILKATVAFPPFLSGKAFLEYLINKKIIDDRLRDAEAYAVIERRWTVKDFSEHEVLYLLAYGIGQLFSMVREAHSNAQINADTCSVVDSIHPLSINTSGIPVCMSSVNKTMQETIGLSDFISRQIFHTEISTNLRLDEKPKRRYKKVLGGGIILATMNPFDFGETLFKNAKQILQIDGAHINLLFTQTADLKWKMNSVMFEDQVSKHIFWNDIAERVKKENIISIVFIGECWVGSFEVMQKQGLRAAKQPERKEALAVDIFTSDMQAKSFRVLFHKNMLGKVVFDKETEDYDCDMSMGYIKPIADVWIALEKKANANS